MQTYGAPDAFEDSGIRAYANLPLATTNQLDFDFGVESKPSNPNCAARMQRDAITFSTADQD